MLFLTYAAFPPFRGHSVCRHGTDGPFPPMDRPIHGMFRPDQGLQNFVRGPFFMPLRLIFEEEV